MNSVRFVVFSVLLLGIGFCASQSVDYECGVSSESQFAALRRRRDVANAKSPWLAVLYAKRDGKWEQICTGTLVSPHIVITAAHCLEYQDLKNRPTDIKIGLGKSSRHFDTKEDSAVLADVREVVVPEFFIGQAAWFANDVALIDLTNSVKISKFLMPACLDWGKDVAVKDQELGQIAGWWKTPEGSISEEVLSAEVPVLLHRTCVASVNKTAVRKRITPDKLCAKVDTGIASNIGPPSSGIAVTVKREGRQHIVGVLSTKLTPEQFVTLSSLSYSQNREWLQQQKNRLDKISH